LAEYGHEASDAEVAAEPKNERRRTAPAAAHVYAFHVSLNQTVGDDMDKEFGDMLADSNADDPSGGANIATLLATL